jgi:hypothetical protein
MQAGAATSQLQRGPNYLVKTLAVLSYGEAEWLKGGSRDPRWEGSSVALIRPSEETGNGDRKLEKDAEGKGRSRGGRAVFMVVEKQRGSYVRAFPDRTAAKPGWSNTTTEITFTNILKS